MSSIENDIRKTIAKIGYFDDVGQRSVLINFVLDELVKYSPFKQQPVSNVKWVPADSVEPNGYNPNVVAPPEMRSLHTSIKLDGFTQPIVVIYDSDKKKYIVVDGYHRSRIGKEKSDIRLKLKGFLPVVILKKDIKDRMASTIRHNRAKGAHTINGMVDVVKELSLKGWDDEEIQSHLGMNQDEVFRLKQFSGLPELFKDRDFSKTWV